MIFGWKGSFMEYLQCPYCKEQAAKGWELLIAQSNFWRTKKCRNCGKMIRFNTNTLYEIRLSLIIGIVLANTIGFFIDIDYFIFNFLFLLFFICIPIVMGRKLFVGGQFREHP